MSFFEKNKKILLSQYPGFLENITAKNDDNLSAEDIVIDDTPSGEPTLSIRGVSVHSRRDPLREGQRLAESVSAEKGAVVILGFGLGYAAQEAVKLCRPLIVVERHKKILLKALESRDFGDFLSKNRIIFLVGGEGDGITSALNIANDLLPAAQNEENKSPAPSVIRNKVLTGFDEKWYGAVDDRIRAWAMKDDVNTATLKRFGRRWVRNIARNMTALRDYPGVSCLLNLASKEEGNSLPVFLAAAGPSLDRIKPLLRDIHSRCIIAAVDTSLRFFIENGVNPDFVVVMDPQFWNSRHLDRCLRDGDNQTALITETSVYPSVMHLPFKHKFICASIYPPGLFIEKQVDPKGRLGSGGSVATTAWDFARSLGGSEIWIAGLDLAFPGLKTHFRGARFEALSNSSSSRFNPAEKWIVRALRDGVPFKSRSALGGEVLTDKRLSLYASWFENQFRQYPQTQNHCLFQEGLHITGMRLADTEKFLALPNRREEIDLRIKEAFFQAENNFNNAEEKQKRSERYENAVSDLKNELENVKKEAAKGAETARQVFYQTLTLCEQEKIYRDIDIIKSGVTRSKVKEVIDFVLPVFEEENINAADTGTPFQTHLKSALGMFLRIEKSAEFLLTFLN